MKFGRLPRKRNPRVPHLSSLVAGQTLTSPPSSIDYTKGLPQSLGMFGNDSLGDCTCAAIYHALQVWSFNGQGAIDTEPDNNAVLLYEKACGYVPGKSDTDQGGNEQDVLSYVMLAGAPVGPSGGDVHKITAFVEIDPRNFDDVKLSIFSSGVVYLGFDVPSYLPQSAGSTWDVVPSTTAYTDQGGHAVVAAGYTADGLIIISWGAIFFMTWGFWSEFVDEAYLLADPDWFKSTGLSPPGGSLVDLEAQMIAMREPAQ